MIHIKKEGQNLALCGFTGLSAIWTTAPEEATCKRCIQCYYKKGSALKHKDATLVKKSIPKL